MSYVVKGVIIDKRKVKYGVFRTTNMDEPVLLLNRKSFADEVARVLSKDLEVEYEYDI